MTSKKRDYRVRIGDKIYRGQASSVQSACRKAIAKAIELGHLQRQPRRTPEGWFEGVFWMRAPESVSKERSQ